MSDRPPKSGLCIASCILGVFGFLSCGLTSLPAIICGHMGSSRVRRSGGTLTGGGLATTGLITGYVSLLLALVLLPIGFLTMGNFKYAQASAQRNRTYASLAALKAALEQYKETFGEYPSPAKTGIHAIVAGQDFDVSSALMLYQAITGDGDDMIGAISTAPSPSDGIVSEGEAKHGMSTILPKGVVLKTSAGYILVDGYGHPFQYTKGGADSVNPTYDLWSFGEAGPPWHTDKATKLDEAEAAKPRWIRNW